MILTVSFYSTRTHFYWPEKESSMAQDYEWDSKQVREVWFFLKYKKYINE